MQWQVIVPVKPASSGKSRLGLGPVVARAVALDTVVAVAATPGAERVLVVTADLDWPAPEGTEVLRETEARGIAAAVDAGVAALDTHRPIAVLLGDLPALDPAELAAALTAAAEHPTAFVRDADGTGTTLVTALAGVPLLTAFGERSAARHAALVLAEVELPLDSSVRRDVDTREQLAALRDRLGPHTAAAFA